MKFGNSTILDISRLVFFFLLYLFPNLELQPKIYVLSICTIFQINRKYLPLCTATIEHSANTTKAKRNPEKFEEESML